MKGFCGLNLELESVMVRGEEVPYERPEVDDIWESYQHELRRPPVFTGLRSLACSHGVLRGLRNLTSNTRLANRGGPQRLASTSTVGVVPDSCQCLERPTGSVPILMRRSCLPSHLRVCATQVQQLQDPKLPRTPAFALAGCRATPGRGGPHTVVRHAVVKKRRRGCLMTSHPVLSRLRTGSDGPKPNLLTKVADRFWHKLMRMGMNLSRSVPSHWRQTGHGVI
ncbi:hypothetical protein LXA43DRAFT_497361 [Ganoderma leucocontextum]|nr:hypothetical protein LXA43DRAFT_497361 [Ganoderma leucocontextum]